MFLNYALMGCAEHEMEEENSVEKMVAECCIVHVYKVQINLYNCMQNSNNL